MEGVGEISNKYHKPLKIIHSDLLYLLKRRMGLCEKEEGRLVDSEYVHSLYGCLRDIGALEDVYTTIVVSDTGCEMVRRGYVYEDLHEIEKSQVRERIMGIITLIIAIIGAFTGIAGLFFPRERADNVVQEVTNIIEVKESQISNLK